MERPFTIHEMNHIVLRVRNLQKSVDFYSMLGSSQQGEVSAGTLMRIPNGQSIILQERPEYVPAEINAVDHINLMIQAKDIYEVTSYLRENGAEIVGEPEVSRAGPTVFAKDPDGIMLEIRIMRDSENAPARA